MSNLIKSVYFHFDPEESRVIDSDSQVSQFVPELFQPGRQESAGVESAEGFYPIGGDREPAAAELTLLSEHEDMGHPAPGILSMDEVRREERKRVEQEASEQIAQMLDEARRQADAILQQAGEEAEQLKAQAYDAGKEQGFAEGQAAAQDQLFQLKNQLEEDYNTRLEEVKAQELELEPRFAEIMGMLIEKVAGVLCQDKKDTIIYLIHQAMNQLERTKNITLRVSKEDFLLVSGNKDSLKEGLAEDVEFQVTEDESLMSNQCIIETDHKMIDCSLDVQLQNVKDQIRMLTIL